MAHIGWGVTAAKLSVGLDLLEGLLATSRVPTSFPEIVLCIDEKSDSRLFVYGSLPNSASELHRGIYSAGPNMMLIFIKLVGKQMS